VAVTSSDLGLIRGKPTAAGTPKDPIQQFNHRLVDSQRIYGVAAGDPTEQTPLQQITLSIAPATRKLEQSFGTIIDARVKSSKGVAHQPRIHTEPITTVSFWADWISPVNLASVVERHHIRIGDER